MSIDTITPNPSAYALQSNRTVEKESVDVHSNLTSADISAAPAVNAKSLLPAVVVRELLKPTQSTREDIAKLSKLVENERTTEFRQTLDVIRAKNEMAMHAVVQKQALLAGVAASLSSSFSALEGNEHSEALAVLTRHDLDFLASARAAAAFSRTMLADVTESTDGDNPADDPELLCIFNAVASDAEFSTSSSKEICDAVADAIGSMGENYLDPFQEAVEVYASFYSDFSEAIASLKNYIKADDDKIVFDGEGFAAELSAVTNKYKGDSGVLYRASSPEEARAWAKEMGLDPDKCVVGKTVRIDLSPIDKLIADTKKNKNVTLNSAQWAAYQSSVDIVKDSVQTSMQSLTQKYSNANSTFDNLVKILSSTISQLLESDKSFFNI